MNEEMTIKVGGDCIKITTKTLTLHIKRDFSLTNAEEVFAAIKKFRKFEDFYFMNTGIIWIVIHDKEQND